MESKKLVQYCNSNTYVVLVPVYYEHENIPAWRKVFKGNIEECKNIFDTFPDHMIASFEENKENRKWKMQEYLFLLSINKTKKAMEIKKQYNF